MLKHFVSKKNRALLSELVRTDFKLRYQGSILGYAWSLLRPLFMFAILYVVFTQFLKLGDGVPHYPVYLLLGIVLWQFFSDTTVQGLGSVVARGDLIRKIRIPRWMIVLTSSASATINLCLNLIVVAVLMVINQVDFTWSILWLPVIIFEIYIFATGLALILSAAYVKYRDVSFIWEVVMQAGFYLTPIIYPLSKITTFVIAGYTVLDTTAHRLLLLNPVAQAMQDARSAVVTVETITAGEVWGTGLMRVVPLVISLIVMVIGILYFKKEAKYFAENL